MAQEKKATPQELVKEFRDLLEDYPDIREEFRDMCYSLELDEDNVSSDTTAKAWYIRGILESMADKVWEIIKKI